LVCIEHADLQGESAPEILVQHGGFVGVRDHPDLTGRPRFVTAVRR
jgi:release factor glutamine methyltransferase